MCECVCVSVEGLCRVYIVFLTGKQAWVSLCSGKGRGLLLECCSNMYSDI